MLFYKISVKYSNNTRIVVYNSFNHIKDLLDKYTKSKAVKNIEVSVAISQPRSMVNQPKTITHNNLITKMITHNNLAIKQHINNDWLNDTDTTNPEYIIDPEYMFY